ncbi:MAG: ribonuclease HII [Ignavibacteriae bacterium]|nr:MAG: ribonuclease HII [Ignavibacteriota bacterium]
MNELKKFDNSFYAQGIDVLVGVDEAGRGPLAGPVVAAAVIFSKDIFIEGITDSKKITEKKREQLAEIIKEKAIEYEYGIIDKDEIDRINILQATLKAIETAVKKLKSKLDLVLIDGNKTFITEQNIKTIVKGDSKSFSVAAASILAKVKRDEIMIKYSEKYPEYNWQKNKGYGTKEHITAIQKYGITELHRKTFLKKILK